MSFDDLFILPNEDTTQSGGHEPFTILKYTGSDTLTKRPELELIKPYILVKKEVPTTSVDTLEGYEAATGLSEGDIMAVNGDAFLQILENQGMGGGLEKHLFFNPNNAALLPIEEVLGEQVIFLATFHQLYFLGSINKLGLPALNTPINERFDALKALLKDEQIATSVFGISHKDMSDYFTEIQTNYVGREEMREKSFVDICELILGEPTDILKYFKDAVALASAPKGNAGSAYTGSSTRNGYNSISVTSGTQAGNTHPGPRGASTTAKPTGAPTGIGANTGITSAAVVGGPTGTATGVATGVPKVNGNANNNGASTNTLNEDDNGNNSGPVRTLGSEGVEAEGKEGEDDGESKEGDENAGSATGSSSSGNPHSVAASAAASAQEGKEGDDEDVEFGPVNARLTANVPAARKVKPPTIPRTNATLSARRSRQAALAARKYGPNTFANTLGRQGNNENEHEHEKPRRVSRKKGKKGKKEKNADLSERIDTNNTTAAVHGRDLEEEVVSNNESEEGNNESEAGYNTAAAVAPTRGKPTRGTPTRGKPRSVVIRGESTAINTHGFQTVVPTAQK